MRGRAMAKRPEPAQQRDLLLAEPRDINDRLCARQHREQAQQQHLGERIDHLAGLARIRQILEIVQENNRLAKRRQVRTPLHRSPPHPNQRTTTDSAPHPFVTNFFTRSPWLALGLILIKSVRTA